MRWSEFPKWLKAIIVTVILTLFVLGALNYPGNLIYYALLSLVANVLLYFGFRDNAIFFDTFIGVFFWLGFWMKLSFRLAFMDGKFVDAGAFDGSIGAMDRVALVSSCGLFALVVASYLRERFIFNYPKVLPAFAQDGLFWLYGNYRKLVLCGFLVFIVFIGFTNVYLGIYQRGEVVRTVLPFGLNRLVIWLLFFGLAATMAVILNFEFRLSKKTFWLAVIYSFLEGAISSTSQLSRAMILNSGSILYGAIFQARLGALRLKKRLIVVVLLAFFGLFVSSAIGVTYVRNHAYVGELFELKKRMAMEESEQKASNYATPADKAVYVKENVIKQSVVGVAALFLDRWVGIEGVMAVSSYPHLGWDLWRQGWAEVYDENKLSFYDSNMILSAYRFANTSKFHFVSLSGIVAFFFYPGSYMFLFFSMICLGVSAGLLELLVYRFGGKNLILCSLFGQIIAYRFMNFGYVPGQSYLLFGSIALYVFLLCLVDNTLIYARSKFAT
ncbi:putative membrane protein [Pseudomonas migulae]|uniref:hypothetical protein n=1 Tax=Pseudomonas migulae TaxID=78543 RepID=UPI0020A0CE28|nr:hypothetical protein [Pseudomonas migulae]MCP1497991.1 putative membrane protein [Pseudomonas migulae]